MSDSKLDMLKDMYATGYFEAFEGMPPVIKHSQIFLQRAYESGHRDGNIRKQELFNLERAANCLTKAAEGTGLEVTILGRKS